MLHNIFLKVIYTYINENKLIYIQRGEYVFKTFY